MQSIRCCFAYSASVRSSSIEVISIHRLLHTNSNLTWSDDRCRQQRQHRWLCWWWLHKRAADRFIYISYAVHRIEWYHKMQQSRKNYVIKRERKKVIEWAPDISIKNAVFLVSVINTYTQRFLLCVWYTIKKRRKKDMAHNIHAIELKLSSLTRTFLMF